MRHNRETVSFLLVIAIFLTVSLYKIELPGLYEVESYNLLPAIDVLYNKSLLHGYYSLNTGGRTYPLMITPFMGALDSYILIPIIYLFGLTVRSIRISQIIFAALGVLVTYILCKRLFNKKIALISIFLLCINPMFIAFNRQGLLINSINFPLLGLGIFLIYFWHLKKKIAYLYAGFFILGLPLFNNANFIWCLFALAISYWMIYSDKAQTLFKNKELDGYKLSIAIYFLLLGALPFVLYNMQYCETLRSLSSNLKIYIKEYGFFWYFKGLIRSMSIFMKLVSSSWRPATWRYAAGTLNYLYPSILLLAFIFTPFLVYRKKNKDLFRKTMFIILTLLLILLQSVFALKDLNAYSLSMIYPFVQILIAIFIVEVFDILKKKEVLVAIAHLFLAAFIFMEIFAIGAYCNEIDRTGGKGYFSSQIYNLADFFEKNNHYSPVAMDWGFRYNLLVLSKGRIDAQDFYSIDPRNEKFYLKCDELLKNKNNIYLTHSKDIDTKNIWESFKKYAVSKDFRIERMEEFCKKNQNESKGISIYKIY